MKCISLVCTVHEENGLANIPELCVILERIRPEVIFLESPPDALDQYLNGGSSNDLESASVRQYRARNRVELVPVDLPTPESRFFNDWAHLQGQAETSDSRRLITWHKNYAHEYGFAYLNSEHCGKMWADIYAEMRPTLGKIHRPELTKIFEAWNRQNDLREDEMLKNIRKYCAEKSFEKGAFLIGAAHRQSIINKSIEYRGEHSNLIQWDFSCITSRTNQKR